MVGSFAVLLEEEDGRRLKKIDAKIERYLLEFLMHLCSEYQFSIEVWKLTKRTVASKKLFLEAFAAADLWFRTHNETAQDAREIKGPLDSRFRDQRLAFRQFMMRLNHDFALVEARCRLLREAEEADWEYRVCDRQSMGRTVHSSHHSTMPV